MLTFGQTGVITLCCNGCIDDLSVTQCRDLFLCDQNITADITVHTLSLAGSSTGGLHSGIGNTSVIHSLQNLLCNDHFVTYRAVAALGQTGSSTGGCNSSIGHLGMTGSGNLGIIVAIAASGTGVGSIAGSSTGGSYNSIGIEMLGLIPFAGAGIVSVGTGLNRGFYEITGSVLQHHRLNSDCRVIQFLCLQSSYRLGCIVCGCFGAGFQNDLTGAGRINIGAALGGIDSTGGSIDGAVNLHQSILQSALNTVATGHIFQSNILQVACAAVAAPLIHVINDDTDVFTQRTGGIFPDVQLGTGKEHQVLRHCNIAADCFNGHVVCNGQVKIGRIDGGLTKSTQRHGHGNGGDGDITVAADLHSAGTFQIILNDIAAFDPEHSTAVANEGYQCTLDTYAGYAGGHIGVFITAGMEGHGNFHILDVVLTHGEYAIAVLCHGGGTVTTAEVGALEIFIDAAAGKDLHRTGAGDIAPSIEVCAAFYSNGAAIAHFHKGNLAGGHTVGAVGSALHSTNTKRAFQIQLGAAGHGQCAVGTGLGVGSNCTGLCGIHRVGCIVGNQQRNAGRNGIFAGSQGGIVGKHHDLAITALCCCHSRGKVVIQIIGTVVCYNIIRSCIGKYRFYRHIRRRDQGIAGIQRQQLTGSRIQPAYKAVAAFGCSHNRSTCFRVHFYCVAAGKCRTCYGDGAAIAVILEGHIGNIGNRLQREAAQGQGCCVAGKALVGYQHQCHSAARFQNLGEITAGRAGCAIYRKATIGTGGIREGQLGFIRCFIGNGDSIGLLGEQAAFCRNCYDAVGNCIGVCRIGNGNLTVQHSDLCCHCLKYCHGKCHDQYHKQDKTFCEIAFHVFSS